MLTESGVAGSAVVEHPYNRMITMVLRRTAHLRPTDGIHHPSGLSVAPLLAPKHFLLPTGPVIARRRRPGWRMLEIGRRTEEGEEV